MIQVVESRTDGENIKKAPYDCKLLGVKMIDETQQRPV